MGHYKGRERCRRPWNSKKPKSPRKSAEASEFEHIEKKSISAGKVAGLFQSMTALVAQVKKVNKMNTMIKVPHMLSPPNPQYGDKCVALRL